MGNKCGCKLLSSASLLPTRAPTNSVASSKAVTADRSFGSVHPWLPGAPYLLRRVCRVLNRETPLRNAAAITLESDEANSRRTDCRLGVESAVNAFVDRTAHEAANSIPPAILILSKVLHLSAPKGCDETHRHGASRVMIGDGWARRRIADVRVPAMRRVLKVEVNRIL